MKYNELNLHPKMQAGVESQNYSDCTPIQEAAIPHILSGHDIAGLAQTGTGKTAAFLVPIMDRVLRSIDEANKRAAEGTDTTEASAENKQSQVGESGTKSVSNNAELGAEDRAARYLDTPKEASTQRPIFENWRGNHFVLVLVPTRELAEQVSENAAKLCAHTGFKVATIYGGTSYETQKAALKEGVQFIVATPGRLIDLYKEHLVDLNQVRAIIFDEADRMFDMGFKDDMKFILKRVPKDRQFLVFSATLNFDVLNVAYEFGANPVEVNVSKDQAKADNVKDELFHVGHQDKPRLLLSLIKKMQPRQLIIFSNFKHNVERIAQFLTANGHPAMAISSLLTQAQRNRVMENFKLENEHNILVATDLAARGLDVKGVDLVINFELPDDAENYVHRIGRTGRAGAKGLALSLVGDRDVEALQRVEQYLGHKIEIGWMEDSELVSEFKPFPSEKHRERPQGRFGNDRGGRNDRGPRQDRGPRNDRGPREERNASGPRNDRPRHDRPRDDRAKEDRQQNAPREGQPKDPNRQQQGDRQRPHRPDLRLSREERALQAAQHAERQKQQGNRFKHRPGTTPATEAGVMQKVSRFFKNLFGGGKTAAPAANKTGNMGANQVAGSKPQGQNQSQPKRPNHNRHGGPRHQQNAGPRRNDQGPRHNGNNGPRQNQPNRNNQPK